MQSSFQKIDEVPNSALPVFLPHRRFGLQLHLRTELTLFSPIRAWREQLLISLICVIATGHVKYEKYFLIRPIKQTSSSKEKHLGFFLSVCLAKQLPKPTENHTLTSILCKIKSFEQREFHPSTIKALSCSFCTLCSVNEVQFLVPYLPCDLFFLPSLPK